MFGDGMVGYKVGFMYFPISSPILALPRASANRARYTPKNSLAKHRNGLNRTLNGKAKQALSAQFITGNISPVIVNNFPV